MLKKSTHLTVPALVAGLLLGAGCRKEAAPPDLRITFSIQGEDTRVTAAEGESRVDCWTLLLYRDGRLCEAAVSDSEAPITRDLQPGTYTAFAVVNPPEDFPSDGQATLDGLSRTVSRLEDNAPGRLVMAGSRTITLSAETDSPQTIGVDRLVCKSGIRKISVAFDDPVLSSLEFRLEALYLTNVCGASRYGSDLPEEESARTDFPWYNRMGYQENLRTDPLLADRGIRTAVTPARPYDNAHTFYFYPNATVADNRSEGWTPRHTRLVIEASIGGRTYYYPVTLPPSGRNRTYLIEEAVIRTLGSEDPEQDRPGSVEITFRTDDPDWNPLFNVNENS